MGGSALNAIGEQISAILWNVFNRPRLIDLIDILLLTIIIYELLVHVRQTRVSQTIKGIIILLIAMFFHCFMDVPWIAAMFNGIRPAVVALIAVPTFNLAKSAKISLVNCWIPIISALLIWAVGVNPIFIIIAAAAGGYIYGQFIKPTE